MEVATMDQYEDDVLSGRLRNARQTDGLIYGCLEAIRAGRIHGKTWIGEEWTAQTCLANALKYGSAGFMGWEARADIEASERWQRHCRERAATPKRWRNVPVFVRRGP